jgi:hypothetical protein
VTSAEDGNETDEKLATERRRENGRPQKDIKISIKQEVDEKDGLKQKGRQPSTLKT